MINKNDIQAWDIDKVNYADILSLLLSWARTSGFGIIKRKISKKFGAFKGLQIVELGAGLGKISILMNILGAETTLIDNNRKAVKWAKEVHGFLGCKSKILLENVFSLPEALYNSYDVAMSFGLAEHFLAEERIKIFQSHDILVKKNGMVVIWVPNTWGINYRLSFGIRKALRKWPKGLTEIPFTRKELKDIAKTMGFSDIRIFGGGSFKRDFDYFLMDNLKAAIHKYLLKRKGIDDKSVIKGNVRDVVKAAISQSDDYQGLLDKYFSYPLILIAEKSIDKI